MTNILHMRAHRFDALYQLLTGGAHVELRPPFDRSDYLRKDIGLPERICAPLDAAPARLLLVNPFLHTLQGRPVQ